MKNKSIFITATGTDIGKTYISALILKKMKEYDLNCGYYKPVLSGDGEDELNDCEYVIKKSGITTDPNNCVSYKFSEAVSPHLAAQRREICISPKKILNDYKNICEKYDYTLIEGAGGICCPICDERYLMWNLIKDLRVSVVIVADGGLGTINSVLTSVEYIKNRNIEIKGLILNNFEENNFMHLDNLKMIEKMSGIKVLTTVNKNQTNLNMGKTDLLNIFM